MAENEKKKFSIDQLSSLYRELCEDDGADEELELDGELEQRYEKLKPIAVGSFKKVWKVFDRKTERYLALAELLDPFQAGAKQRFLREAKLTALLDHPNIISVYDIGVNEEGKPFFVMELKDGNSLHEAIFKKHDSKASVDAEMGIQTFLKVCDAIDYAHSRGVLHLDLKPANIQVGEHGETRVGDWGMGQLLHSVPISSHIETDPDLMTPLTVSDHIRGTPGYMAPEQTELGYQPDSRSDIFALGVLLFVILTKRSPIEGENTELIENTKHGRFHHVHSLPSGMNVPSGLKAIIRKAMALQPNDRYQKVSSLQQDLRQYLKGYPTLAEGRGWYQELHYFYKRNRAVTLTTMIALLFIAAVTLIFIVHLKQSELEAHQSRRQAELSLELSNQERSRAEQLQMLYLREKQFAEDVVSRTYHLNFEVLQKNTQPNLFNDPIGALKEAEDNLSRHLLEEPNHSGYKQQMGLLYLIRQNFSLAFEELSKFGHGIEDLVQLCGVLKNRYPQHKLLPLEGMLELVELMSKQQDHFPLLMMILAYDAVKRDLGDHAQVIHALLKIYNPEWISTFNFNKKDRSLILKGDDLNTLSVVFQPLLKTLNLKYLDLRFTNFRDFSQLKGLNLKTLDIRKTQVRGMTPLIGQDICDEVLIEPNQFSAGEIDQVSKVIKVEQRELLSYEPSKLVFREDFVDLNNKQSQHYLSGKDFENQDLYWTILVQYPSTLTFHALIKAGGARCNGYEISVGGDQKEFFPNLDQSIELNHLVEIGTFFINDVGVHDVVLRPLFNRFDEPLPQLAKLWIEENDGYIELNPKKIGVFNAIDAEIQGESARFLSQPNKRCIGVWHGTNTTLSWPVKILKTGEVDVKVALGIPKEHGGGQVKLKLGNSSLTFDVPTTEDFHIFKVFNLGKLNIEYVDNARLELIPLKAGAKNVVMDLKSVILEGEAEVIYDKRTLKILEGYEISRR